MRDSGIYSDFASELGWIMREIARDANSVGPSKRALARFYTETRLRLFQGIAVVRLTDQRMGRPIPYLALWFADAYGITDERLIRLAGLSLARSSIAATIRDDMGESGAANYSAKARLARFWSRRYNETLRRVFPSVEGFKVATSWADAEWRKFEDWNTAPMGDERWEPFSADFLRESSRYYLACAVPSLVALAHAAGRNDEAPRIERFLTNFSMGWKIFDDLMDWEGDLAVSEMNRSSVLIYISNRTGNRRRLDRTEVLNWFLDEGFVDAAYGAMASFFLKAKKAVASFGDSYLDRFMEEQIEFQSDKRDSIRASANLALSDLNRDLTAVLGPGSRHGPRKRDSLA